MVTKNGRLLGFAHHHHLPLPIIVRCSAMASKANPLPLSDTLRDLALLRSCDIDLSTLLPSVSSTSAPDASEADALVARSYEFVREARAALRIMNREQVDEQGGRVEDIRNALEDVVRGLSPNQS